MSLGGPYDVPELHQAVKNTVKNDILVVYAAGNEGDNNGNTDEFGCPGCYPEVVEVGAVDREKKVATFSNTNKNVDLVVPGVEILSIYIGGGYAKLSGTSMATPHISGGLH